MIRKRLSLFLFAMMAGVMTLTALPAKANITITPTIVVIEGRNRYADVHIINTTNQRQSYEIAWKFMRMKEGTGNYEIIDQSLTPFDLSQNIIFTPRRLALEPKGVQKIRLAMRLKGDMPAPGDYRAHLQLINVGKRSGATPTTDGDPRASSVNVNVNLGFSIPVIYRVGDVNGGKASIGNVTTEINPKTKRIEAIVPVTRAAGAYGVIGTLTVNYDGKKIGQLRNANIFPEVNGRVFRVPLQIQSLSGGALDIVYSDYDQEKDIVFDRKSVGIAR